MPGLTRDTPPQQGADARKNRADHEERYRFLFDQAAEFIVIHDLKGRIVDANESLCSRLGYTRKEMLQLNMGMLIDPEQLKETPLRMNELIEGKCIFSERRYVGKDGSRIEIEANVKKMSNDLILGICRDVTERKKMEFAMREAELKFRTISEKSLVGIYIIQDGRFAYVNPKFAEILGYPPEEMVDSFPVDIIVDEEDKDRVKEYIRARMAGEVESVHFEAKGRKKDGTLIYAEVFGSRSLYKDRTAIIGTLIDITERKTAEDRVLRERNLSNDIIDCLPGIFFLQDEQGRYLRWNKHFGKLTGYSEEEIRKLNPLDFFEESQREEVRQKIHEIFANPNGEADLEAEVITRDGRKIPYYFKGKYIQYEGRPCLIGTGINITELRSVEKNLRNSEANLKTIFNNTDTIYVLMDSEFRVISFNQRAAAFASRELQQSLQTMENFIKYFPEHRRSALSDSMKRVRTGEHVNYEVSYPKKDGSRTWYYVRLFPITYENREVLGIMAAVSDTTAKKLMEQEILNQKIQEQKKITRAVIKAQEKERNTIGQELHDNVNQILATSRLYLTSAVKTKVIKKDLIVESTGLLDDAIQEIRLLSKNQITPQGNLGLKELIQLLVNNLNQNASIYTRFEYEVATHPIKTELKLNIYRIIQEQINNILKHAEATHVSIRLISGNGYLTASVTDDGKGFNLKAKRKGIGITNMINRVESFNGELTITSNPGHGCTLLLKMPV